MYSHQMKTEAVKQCFSCATGLPALDRFCRSCGISQPERAITAASKPNWSECTTKAVSLPGGDSQASQTLSSLLVNSLAQSVAVKTTPLHCGRLGIRVIGGLVVIPIWLLIILLSPFDAYAAAKAASSQLSYE